MTYSEFINNIIETRGQGNIPEGEYYEKHHIIPKCLGGTGDKKDGSFYSKSKNKNCIGLYPEEHFTAHRLLYEENKDDIHIIKAYGMICRGLYKKEDISEENYRKVKIEGYNKTAGVKLSEEHKNKIGMSNRGNKRPDLSEYNHKFKKGSKDSYSTHIKKCIAQTGAKNNNSKKVRNLDTNEVFDYMTAAAKSVNGSAPGMSCYLNNNNRRGITKYKGYRGDGYKEF